jgi:MOSC domain-containing protein YiiM
MNMSSPYLVSVQVGLPRLHDCETAAQDPPFFTAFFKDPVEGLVWLGRTNLASDGQADREHHGGPDKAVLAYAASHYPHWREELRVAHLPPAAFGENFTIAHQAEEDVCIGDTYALGEARVQVCQPRRPCWKLARRLGFADLPQRVQQTGRSGWYLRVLTEGHVERGLPLVLLERPWPQWTVARVNDVLYHGREDREAMTALAAVPPLAESWRTTLVKRLGHLTG